ncbi:MAG: ammonium transporter [Bacteroidetes bacterium]|nr:ammonium transporter [Bacteroidota bacterium]
MSKKVFLVSVLVPCVAVAGDMEDFAIALNTMWVLLAAFLVFFMQVGFGMVESGLTRAKNAVNILMKNTMDFGMAMMGFFIFGYAIMFGGEGPLVGTKGWLLFGISGPDGLPLYAFWLFQAMFCGTAATIVSGGVAERMRFVSYLIYSIVISAVIYPVIGHWVWGGGWLAGLGFYDFAGSTVVHVTGGFAALAGTMILGPRIGKYNKDGSVNSIAGHNMPLLFTGVIILWFGWFGFNGGSALSFADPELIARICINTSLAASAGIIAAMLTTWFKFGKPELPLTLNGALAGLVGITAPCAAVSPISAIIIGAVAGLLVIYSVVFLDKMKIDDPVGAIPVHGINGVWGTLAVGLFGQQAFGLTSDGLFYGGGAGQLGVQALGTFSIAIFVFAAMWVVFKVIDKVVGLRVSEKEELQGLDIVEHRMESYHGFQIFTTE